MSASETERPDWPTRQLVLKTCGGLVVAVILVYLLGYAIGWEETIERLATTRLEWVLVGGLSTLLCLLAWGKVWHVVLESIGVKVSYRTLIGTFFAATFTNYVTPMGKAGGEPFIAYLLSKETGTSYEESLASVVMTDLLRLIPFFTVGGFGLAYLVLRTSLTGPIETIAGVFVALALLLPVATMAGWRGRRQLRRAIIGLSAPVARRSERLSLASIRDRIDEFFETLEQIAESPRALLVAIGLTYVGWILFALPLYFAGLAIGTPISILLVFFLVPVSVIAGTTPLPGGIGAIEATLVVFLVALTSITSVEALAITAIYRLVSYWFVIGVGGIALLWVIKRL